MSDLARGVLAWLALPISPELAEPELERIAVDAVGSPWIGALVDATRGDAIGPLPSPSSDLEAIAGLLATGQRAALLASGAPSLEVTGIAGDVDRLASASGEIRRAGLSGTSTGLAASWTVAYAADPLGAGSQALLRVAVDSLLADAPRRGLAQAFATFGDACAREERADLWQTQVEYLVSTHGPTLPVDLAWAVAMRACRVIEEDPRWFRAGCTRRQAEDLLTLRLDARDQGAVARADVMRAELAKSYLAGRVFDEKPWIDYADDVMIDLLNRLGPVGADHAVTTFTELVVRASVPGPRKARSLRAWTTALRKRDLLAPELEQLLVRALEIVDRG